MDVAVSVRTCSREIVGTDVDSVTGKSSCTSFVDSGVGLVQVLVVEGGEVLDTGPQRGRHVSV